MSVINIHDAKTNFSKLVHRAAAGEEIVIAKEGEPMARLVPLEPPLLAPRVFGDLRGKIRFTADCFERDEETESLFENSVLFPTADANSGQ